MILLGINAGLGNTDVACLEKRHLDLDRAWLDFPRPKTGIERRAALWPETVQALKDALAVRPDPKDPAHAERVFLTHRGAPWIKNALEDQGRDEEGAIKGKIRLHHEDALKNEMTSLLKHLDLKRPRLGFYTLRHVFETIAGEARDQVAVDLIMGHADQSMAAQYRERISDVRLQLVAEHVRQWLFPEPEDSPAVLPMNRAN
jgi:integrase